MKRTISLLIVILLCLSLTVPAAAAAADTFVLDEADLLTPAEESRLSESLRQISRTYNAQIMVATVAAAGGVSADTLVEDFYDTRGLGYGADHDGVLLLVCMDPREYRILSNGFAADAITDSDIDTIGDAIVSDLSDGDYAGAFDTFAGKCAYYLDGHLNGFPFAAGKCLAIALVIGVLAGVITAFVLKGQLKTVRKQERANVYVKSGSMQVTASHDLFLYRNVSRSRKESSGNSSGSSRNVGGGSF